MIEQLPDEEELFFLLQREDGTEDVLGCGHDLGLRRREGGLGMLFESQQNSLPWQPKPTFTACDSISSATEPCATAANGIDDQSRASSCRKSSRAANTAASTAARPAWERRDCRAWSSLTAAPDSIRGRVSCEKWPARINGVPADTNRGIFGSVSNWL